MAGVKGRSGGPRANSGGRRAGAGRKPKNPTVGPTNDAPAVDASRKEPLAFLEDVLNDPNAPLKDRIRAAIAAAQYRHTKLHDGGKKEEQQRAAEKSAGRFRVSAPPLRVVKNA